MTTTQDNLIREAYSTGVSYARQGTAKFLTDENIVELVGERYVEDFKRGVRDSNRLDATLKGNWVRSHEI